MDNAMNHLLKLLLISIGMLSMQACSSESDRCRSIIKSSYQYITGYTYSVEGVNDLNERNKLLSNLRAYSDNLNDCRVIVRDENDIDKMSIFTIYKSDIDVIIKLLHVNEAEIPAGYFSVIILSVERAKKFPIDDMLSMTYKVRRK